jgi:hemerythrin superfamily protein
MSLPATGDIVDILLAQHAEVLAVLDEVRKGSGEQRAGAFSRLQALLHTHERGEQEVVHPVTRGVVEDPEIVADRVREEQQADLALAELRGLDLDSAAFDERFREFRDAVIAHAGWEERVEFPALRQSRTAEQLLAMANRLRTVQSMHWGGSAQHRD